MDLLLKVLVYMIKSGLFLFVLIISNTVFSEIYKWTDDSGRVHYSDKASTSLPVEIIAVKVNSYEHVSFEVIIDERPKKRIRNRKVVMYSTSWCGYCKKARKYFIANSIAFIEHDIEKDKRAKKRYDKLGGKGIPVIIYGKKRMNGFSISGFKKIYSKKT